MSILAPDFPGMDVAQFKTCVTCTATPDRDQVYQVVTALHILHIQGICLHWVVHKRNACGPKTSICADQNIETSEERI
jgi:hypothetical protein